MAFYLPLAIACTEIAIASGMRMNKRHHLSGRTCQQVIVWGDIKIITRGHTTIFAGNKLLALRRRHNKTTRFFRRAAVAVRQYCVFYHEIHRIAGIKKGPTSGPKGSKCIGELRFYYVWVLESLNASPARLAGTPPH